MIISNERSVILTNNIAQEDIGCNGAHVAYPWLLDEWALAFETPYTYNYPYQMGRGNPDYCKTDRIACPDYHDNCVFILNNFITPPSYTAADNVNGYPKLLDSAQYCHEVRADAKWPNFIAVDFENCDSKYTCNVAQGHNEVPDVVDVANALNLYYR